MNLYMSTVQSVLFEKKHFTLNKALAWMEKNDFKINKIDETKDYYRFRQVTPPKFGFRFYTFPLKTVQGVKLIMITPL